jgi:hypothetical protein
MLRAVDELTYDVHVSGVGCGFRDHIADIVWPGSRPKQRLIPSERFVVNVMCPHDLAGVGDLRPIRIQDVGRRSVNWGPPDFFHAVRRRDPGWLISAAGGHWDGSRRRIRVASSSPSIVESRCQRWPLA